tara:strand:+ start:76 stop:729 length:654 start_codon:yes stop_codon:yes gene_type:complete
MTNEKTTMINDKPENNFGADYFANFAKPFVNADNAFAKNISKNMAASAAILQDAIHAVAYAEEIKDNTESKKMDAYKKALSDCGYDFFYGKDGKQVRALRNELSALRKLGKNSIHFLPVSDIENIISDTKENHGNIENFRFLADKYLKGISSPSESESSDSESESTESETAISAYDYLLMVSRQCFKDTGKDIFEMMESLKDSEIENLPADTRKKTA